MVTAGQNEDGLLPIKKRTLDLSGESKETNSSLREGVTHSRIQEGSVSKKRSRPLFSTGEQSKLQLRHPGR